MLFRYVLLVVMLCGLPGARLVWAAAPRFSAVLSNGTRLEGNYLSDWHAAGLKPKLEGKDLFAPANPVRWLIDRSLPAAESPSAFVEMISGDCLPGVVTEYRGGVDASYEPLPPHFLVKTEITLSPPVAIKEPVIRVLQRYVRRMVWQRRSRDVYRPATLFYRDGREVAFRAVRFDQQGVNLLLEDGPRKVFFNEIAELHLPKSDAWSSYYDELAALGAHDQTRLIQLETTEGLTVTATLERMNFAVRGNTADFTRWIHGLQPAWSLETLWIPNGLVWVRRLFAPNEVPLARAMPQAGKLRSPLSGTPWPWRRNRNSQGGPLRTGKLEAGWGFGVHADSELRFELPDCVTSFRGQVGLDRLAGAGGCIRARLFANATDSAPLYQSGFLVGSDAIVDTGAIALKGPAGGQKELILQVDSAHQGRPAGADPLDIRDLADWIDPILLLDANKLKQHVASRASQLTPAWQGWTLSTEEGGQVVWKSFWDTAAPPPGAYSRGAIAVGKPLTLKRQVNLNTRDRWLIVAASRSVDSAIKPKVEVRIDDQVVAQYDIPLRNKSVPQAPPLSISLADYHAAQIKQIQVEIRQTVAADVPVQWHAIRITEQMPTLYQLFEDEGRFAAVDREDGEEPPSPAEIVRDDRHTGGAAIKIPAGGAYRLVRGGAGKIRIRPSPSWGEYRYVRFAFRKFGEGRVCLELNHDESADKPARYDAGLGEPCFGKAVRVWVQRLPSQWIVMTRDLYSEFGEIDISGLTLAAPDGEYALFDHVYLARSPADFAMIPQAPSVEQTNQNARRELARPILDKGLAATVAIDLGEGRLASGVVISPEGHVLTAGHALISAGDKLPVHLPDGKVLLGKRGGVWRSFDLGLLKIDPPQPLAHVAISDARLIPSDLLYVGVAHRNRLGEEKLKQLKPHAYIVGIRRVFRSMIWTDFEVEDWSPGGPLLDNDGNLLGIHTRRSRFGGFLYARLGSLASQLDKLKAGEVWGSWSSGSEPVIGLAVESVRQGCRVTAISNAPEMKVGDIIRRIEGRSVVSLADISSRLIDKDPGGEVVADVLRGGKSMKVKLKLLPRLP